MIRSILFAVGGFILSVSVFVVIAMGILLVGALLFLPEKTWTAFLLFLSGIPTLLIGYLLRRSAQPIKLDSRSEEF